VILQTPQHHTPRTSRYLWFLAVALCACQHAKTITTHDTVPAPTDLASRVNVFLGSSGDHGQLSPSASFPFSMLSIGPHTYPTTHTGYEHKAKQVLGFTHTHLEGVGCQGSGGNILVKPFVGTDYQTPLIKASESASPGYYHASFTNGIDATVTVAQKAGMHRYRFPAAQKGISIDLSHTIANRFVAETHNLQGNSVSGWIDTKTTCHAGTTRMYYYLETDAAATWTTPKDHLLIATLPATATTVHLRVGISTVSPEHARANIHAGTFETLHTQARQAWNELLGHFTVRGDQERMNLFYSLLYRTLQSPYNISEADGQYNTISGDTRRENHAVYNGWAIWDNYRTQLPLLALGYPEQYQNIAFSIENLYPYGKKNWATQHEPSPTVRTEHAIVVLLDATRKGYKVDYNRIIDSLESENRKLDYSSPDKALESCYDAWALSEIYGILGNQGAAARHRQQALAYKKYWLKDFSDIRARDADRMQARGLYQGTIWQYRWFVPFDVKGLMKLTGGEQAYLSQLNEFFDNDYYNHANQPDLQVPIMYNMTSQPWKSQAMMHTLAVDTVVQHYLNDNSRGIGSFVDRIYKNEPEAYIRTMDDDAGTMSSWYVWASCGLFPACIGWPVYYIHAPLMEEITMQCPNGKSFHITAENYNAHNAYVKKVELNGVALNRNWLTHQEIIAGGTLKITTAAEPAKEFGTEHWITSMPE
jgi:putative alpha-1,2-mannosidase